jgi:hypothetical protein
MALWPICVRSVAPVGRSGRPAGVPGGERPRLAPLDSVSGSACALCFTAVIAVIAEVGRAEH